MLPKKLIIEILYLWLQFLKGLMCLHVMFVSLFWGVVHMELCKLMQMVILVLKSCVMEIA
jgi:hypothetical protein